GEGPEVPQAALSRLIVGRSFVYPDPDLQIEGLLLLRGGAGAFADAALSELELRVEGGHLARPLRRTAPGSYEFSIAAAEGTGGSLLRLTLLHRGRPLLRRQLPIAVDPHLASRDVTARGGCTGGARSARGRPWAAAALL